MAVKKPAVDPKQAEKPKKVEKSEKAAGLSMEDIAKIIKAKSPGSIFGEANIYEFCTIKKIPTGIPTFDFLSGGGITKGRITIFAGKPSACKTTLTLQIVAKIIRDMKRDGIKKYVLYFDPEGSYDAEYATNLGIDQSYMIINRTTKVIEDAFKVADDMISMGFIEAMVFDSLDGMVARKTDENAYSATMGGPSGAVSQHLPQLFSKIIEHEVTTIFIKQARVKMGYTGGAEVITFSGGYALRHFTDSVYVLGRRKRQGNDNMHDIVIKAEKTRSTRMGLDCIIPLPVRGLGIDRITDLVSLAIGQGIITAGGGGWTSYKTFKEQGLNNFVEAISANREVLDDLEDQVYNDIILQMNVIGVSNNDGEKIVLDTEGEQL